MKAIILVALVATVAARGVDIDTLRLLKEKSLLTRPVVDDVLLKEKELTHRIPLDKNVVVGQDLVDAPVNYIRDYDYDYKVDRVLTIDELYQTELFREYLAIPLFRQYFQYPSFQRYVASLYFQKFWQIPTFRQYFYNPVLFYKYIVPLVQLFHSEHSYPYNYNYDIYGQDTYNRYNTYGQDVYGQDTYNRYNTYGQDVLGYKNLVDDVIYKRNVLPYSADYYNRYTYGQQYPTVNRAGQYFPYALNNQVNHKYILDKIYKTLFVNQPTVGDVTQVKTDVKIVPGEKKFVVEPITGERHIVDESKIVDVKVDQKIVPVETVVPEVDTVYPEYTKYVNERELVILKELLKEKVITPEIYEAVIRGQIQFHTILRQYLGRHFVNNDVYNRDQLVNRDVEIVDLLKNLPIYNRQYAGNDRLVNLINKLYNIEYPTQRVFDHTYNNYRFNPIVA